MSELDFLTILGFGFLLGARHALDADHVAAVSTILSERPSLSTSGVIGFCWGFGHTTVLLLVGIAVIMLKISIPEPMAVAVELAVGVMLVALGLSLAVTLVRERWHLHAHQHDGETHVHLHHHLRRSGHLHRHWVRLSLKPFVVGMVHGLAGSAALMLMVVSTVRTVGEGLAYILVFGLGSVVGMMLLGVAISIPIVLSASCGRRAQEAVQALASLGSIGLGVTMLVRLGSLVYDPPRAFAGPLVNHVNPPRRPRPIPNSWYEKKDGCAILTPFSEATDNQQGGPGGRNHQDDKAGRGHDRDGVEVERGAIAMKIRVLGCHGSDQVLDASRGSHQCRTCAFLVNDTVLVDAGTVGTALRLDEQKRIRHVLLTHLHHDHIQGLPTLADNLADEPDDPVVLTSISEVLKGLQTHVFNDKVYPDFLKLPDPRHPVFVCRPLEPGKESEVAGLRVTAIPVNHLVPTVGFLIRDKGSSFLYSGDTYETEEIWKAAAREPTLKAAFIETSFPDTMTELARASKHLTPSTFAREFRKIGRPDLPVYVYHLKPRVREQIKRELARLGVAKLTVLEEGQEITI